MQVSKDDEMVGFSSVLQQVCIFTFVVKQLIHMLNLESQCLGWFQVYLVPIKIVKSFCHYTKLKDNDLCNIVWVIVNHFRYEFYAPKFDTYLCGVHMTTLNSIASSGVPQTTFRFKSLPKTQSTESYYTHGCGLLQRRDAE